MEAVVSRPNVRVEVGGRGLSSSEAASLGPIVLDERLSRPAQLELSFLEPPDTLREGPLTRPGTPVDVTLPGSPGKLFTGEVTAVEFGFGPQGERTIRIRAYDRLHRLKKRQPVRAHVQVTVEDIAREVTKGDGLTVEAQTAGPRRARILQFRETDFELLSQLAEEAGLGFVLRGETLHLVTLEGLGTPRPLVLGDNLLEAQVEVNGERSCRSVQVTAWDPLLGDRHQGQASDPRSGRAVSAEASPGAMGGEGERILLDRFFEDDAQAEGAARAELDDRSAREVTLSGVAAGDSELHPGVKVEVRGIDSSLEGTYVLSSVTHRIDSRRGYLSVFGTEPLARRPLDRSASATLGRVTRVDDPEGWGRVQVSLPALQDLETGWMETLSPGGGPGKGLVALPEVGDKVLVLLVGGDPSRGIVLGGLFGGQAPPDAGVEGNAVKRFSWTTPGGQRVTLDDGKKRLRLETKDGSFLDLSPDRVEIHATKGLRLGAPGQRILIQGGSIDFEKA
jgi:phage protein D/phage baseplate assembly protein gpV